jgi:hypothetical protein
MSNQPRVVKVLATLLVSMTGGAIILMALGNHPPSAGPFCLSSYYRLNPIELAISSSAPQSPNRWDCIEVYYSGTQTGGIDEVAEHFNLARPDEINCHFVICNGKGGDNGQIQTTQRWQRQWSAVAGQDWYGTDQTIRICLIGEGRTAALTDYQVKRLEMLLETLCRKLDISTDSIYYPGDYR